MHWKIIAALSVSLLHPVAHSEPVKVLGVSMGGLPAKPIRICPQDRDSPILCWIDKPIVAKDGSRHAGVSMPEKDLPAWAAHTTADMSLTPKGTIAFLSVDLRKGCDTKLVAESVAARFGKPTEDRLQPLEIYKTATWELKDIFIHLESAGSFCAISFRTPENIAAQRAFNVSQKVNRPATP
jgi:hypothetical protein